MWTQFFLEHINFALNISMSLVYLAVFWLFLDAWFAHKSNKNIITAFSFLLLALSFTISAVQFEGIELKNSIYILELFSKNSFIFDTLLKLFAYSLLIITLSLTPLTKNPFRKSSISTSALISTSNLPLWVVRPILSSIVGLLYLRRATHGLEHHLKPLALNFFLLSFYDLLNLFNIFRTSRIVDVYNLVRPYGPIWFAKEILLILMLVILGKWVFNYLLKQFLAQLFIEISIIVVIICVATTVVFSGLIVNRVENEIANELKAENNILLYSLSQDGEKLLADASQISTDQRIINALKDNDKLALKDLVATYMSKKYLSNIIIVSKSSQILAQADELDADGDSLDSDKSIAKGLVGDQVIYFAKVPGIFTSNIEHKAVSPIKFENEVLGVVLIKSDLNQAYLEEIKNKTGIDVGIAVENKLSASTIADIGSNRSLSGINVSGFLNVPNKVNEDISNTTQLDIGSNGYIVAYSQLVNAENVKVGYLFTANPNEEILTIAQSAVFGAFGISILLIFLSLVPSYLISRSITKQLA